MISDASAHPLNDKLLRLWGIPLISLSGLLSLMQFFFQGRWDLFGKYLIASLIYTWATWEMCRLILLEVRRRIPGLEHTVKRLVLTMLYFLVVAGLGNMVVKAILNHLNLRPPTMVNKPFFEWWLLNMPNILFFVLLLSSIYEAIYFFEQYKTALRKAKQLKNQQAQQNLDALKTRVNPHFLFNSLTTLSALISEDAPRAEQFVDELSKVYRYLLRAGRQAITTLGGELQFAESYSFLLKNRFEEGAFSLNKSGDGWTSATDLDRTIPVLTFQNALDYLVRTQNVPLHIQVDTLGNHLRIACDNHPKTLSFDASDNDWRQLERNGAVQVVQSGQLSVFIPLTSNTSST